jgi:hypothetical protein
MVSKIEKISLFVLLVVIALTQQNCGFYSFSGSSVPPEIQTFSVETFTNSASLINPLAAQILTEKLKDKLLSESNLSLVEKNGDFDFSGVITNYSVEPLSAEGGVAANLNRFSVSLRVKMGCEKIEKLEFEQVITEFQDFEASQNFASAESSLLDEVGDRIIQGIMNKSANNW